MTSSPITPYYNLYPTSLLHPKEEEEEDLSPYTEDTLVNSASFLNSRCLWKTRGLYEILKTEVALCSKTNELKLVVSLWELLNAFKDAFEIEGISLQMGGVRLIGSTAAALILEQESNQTVACDLNDLDFVFKLQTDNNFTEILQTQEEALCALIREKLDITLTPYECYSMFFNASFCIDNDTDQWSLISLGSPTLTVDIKTVHQCSRPYAFSIDSFEIELDDLLATPIPSAMVKAKVHSNYPSFSEALHHLKSRTIQSYDIGSIHHGLFRYCLELAKGNHSDNLLYEVVLITRFWEEFGNMDMTRIVTILSNFLSKHKKNWFCILTQLHYILSRYNYHPRGKQLMEAIFKLMFCKMG
jgi:hypothetical protein